jgi:catechol 2,3-dioxygenase-like lactoylglutathione lyase family enzyme
LLNGAKAFSGFAVDDVARAREFYGTTLGLEVRLGPGARVLVYPKPENIPRP